VAVGLASEVDADSSRSSCLLFCLIFITFALSLLLFVFYLHTNYTITHISLPDMSYLRS